MKKILFFLFTVGLFAATASVSAQASATPKVILNGYCENFDDSFCELNAYGSVGWKINFAMRSDIPATAWEWEKVSGSFIFTSGNGVTAEPVNNGDKNVSQAATIQINGSGHIMFKIRAKNANGWGQWKYVGWYPK
ncbi:MAG: hypothetical protein E6767_02495 [Dysgonomonas sp.]|nr:hypothetical protein [Dysgonomonas sp.]